MEINRITEKIIGCAIEVHKHLGPGLLESVYQECLSYELQNAGLMVEEQTPISIIYKELIIERGFRIAIMVENQVIIELKSVEILNPVHEVQILTYMKMARKPLGLLINVNVVLLKNGLKRYRL
ncbi:MAG: GxxExxY protein [Bacteroidetes bacterium]|nr:GxxExxY protein [Bacteroidota bacterium]